MSSVLIGVKSFQIEEFKKIYEPYNKEIFECFSEDIDIIYQNIFAVNLFAHRIELKEKFDSQYFKISFSCLLEAYILIIENRVRASCLVLRSSIENFIKHILQSLSQNPCINERVYNKNKSELDKILNDISCPYLRVEGLSGNSFLENEYGKLSGLSHSLTPSSLKNVVNCVMDFEKLNFETISEVLKELAEITRRMFILIIISCNEELKKWDSAYLEEIFKLVLGSRRTRTLIDNIKTSYC